LLSIVFVPKLPSDEDKISIENQLKDLGLSIRDITDAKQSDLIEQLQKNNLDWNNFEQFADFLINFSKSTNLNRPDFSEKAVAIYNYIQRESKTFSFEISNKIASTKANL
jgi:hypothetical protein